MNRASDKPFLRLRDDPTVASMLRGDLSRAASDGDSGYNVAEGLARFETTLQLELGVAAVPSAQAGLGAKPVFGAAAKGAMWGLGAVTIAGVAAAAIYASSPERHAPGAATASPHMTAAAASAEPPKAEPAESVASNRVEMAGPPPAPIAPSPVPIPRPSRTVPPSAPEGDLYEGPPSPGMPPPAASADPLAPEMENLSRLRALEPTDPAQALAVAEEGHRQFPSGLFVQEREALAIAALVRLGRRAEARARAEAFIAAYPKSHFIERIRMSTGIGPGH